MSNTIGEEMDRLFGAYDYVVLRDQSCTTIRRWDKVTTPMRRCRYKSSDVVNGWELSKITGAASDRMDVRYLLFTL